MLDLPELRLLAQLRRPVPQRGQDEVRLLPVEATPVEHGTRLDQQDSWSGAS